MLPTDAYRSKLHDTIAALRYWVPTLRHAADVEDVETETYWRIAVRPRVRAACPFELILHSDQTYDLLIAGEAFERQPVESLASFQPLLEAISSGRAVTRIWRAPTTGSVKAVETIVTLADGTIWQRLRTLVGGRGSSAGDWIATDRRYVPYAREA
ncbi:MAG TPA: hypothetical protein PK264_11545 [Hyphomicrobiaceae bacterium]|nr:hypothetical protein [Hyphomicrobiaceae bacterium]